MNFYIADLHFGHCSVIGFDQRPFADAAEMDRALIQLWNGRVQESDNIYIAGDFAYRNEKSYEWYLRQLKGRKHLIIGNHDTGLLKDDKAMSYFESVDKMMHVSDNGNEICVCHFPLAEWNGFYKGHWHIYGHIHNRTEGTYQYMRQFDKALNAGACINGYIPVSFNELVRNNIRFKEQKPDRR